MSETPEPPSSEGAGTALKVVDETPRAPARGPIIDLKPIDRGRTLRRLLIAAIAVAAFAVAGSLSATGVFGRGLASLASLVGLKGQVSAPSRAASGAPPALADTERVAWMKLDRSDPSALRAHLAQFPGGSSAIHARAALEAVEETAFSQLRAIDDVLARNDAIKAFLMRFPDGRRRRDVGALEAETQAIVDFVEKALLAAGHDPGLVDGVATAETSAAIMSLQRALGVPVTGRIDAALLAHLRAMGASDPPPPAILSPPTRLAPASSLASSRREERASPRAPFRDCFVCPLMIAIPAGVFVMGDAAVSGDPDERPAHSVRIPRPLAIGVHEVTEEEWSACVGDGGCRPSPAGAGDAYPVASVSWSDARQYAAWLSGKSGHRYRLLSEAEWEYAARAGTQTRHVHGDAPEGLCAVANHADADASYSWRNRACSDGFPSGSAPVGTFSANAFGLHDMAGNVWEWVEDCWHESYEGAPVHGAAWTSGCTNGDRILRGGAFSVRADFVRPTYRYHYAPNARLPFFGLRMARELN